jgi:hypothetical protein
MIACLVMPGCGRRDSGLPVQHSGPDADEALPGDIHNDLLAYYFECTGTSGRTPLQSKQSLREHMPSYCESHLGLEAEQIEATIDDFYEQIDELADRGIKLRSFHPDEYLELFEHLRVTGALSDAEAMFFRDWVSVMASHQSDTHYSLYVWPSEQMEARGLSGNRKLLATVDIAQHSAEFWSSHRGQEILDGVGMSEALISMGNEDRFSWYVYLIIVLADYAGYLMGMGIPLLSQIYSFLCSQLVAEALMGD